MSDLQLIEAVKAGDLAALESSIDAGGDVHQQDEQGWTPLNWAAGRGDIDSVKLLVESGADVFKVGRDQRTPYMIALAAGRVEAATFLRQAEDAYPGEKRERPQRQYCKAYHLKDLRQFAGWTESRSNGPEKQSNGAQEEGTGEGKELADDDVVFIHQDLTVTQSMWHAENVIFDQVSSEWEAFCSSTLNFRVPDDLDFIVPATNP